MKRSFAYLLFLTFIISTSCSQDESADKLESETPDADVAVAIPIPIPDLSMSPVPIAAHIRNARESLESSLTSSAAWGHYGDALLANNFFFEAIQSYQRAQIMAPDEARWPASLAFAAKESANFDLALASLFQAKTLTPDDEAILFAEGTLLEEIGDYEVALDSFRAAHQLAPTLAETNFALGRILFNLNRYEESREYLVLTMRSAPDSSLARSMLLRLANVVSLDVAIPSEEEAVNTALLSLKPPYYDEFMKESYLLSEVKERIGRSIAQNRTDAALANMELLTTHYTDAVLESEWVDYAHLLATKSRFANAKESYRQALEHFPNSSMARLGLADLLFRDRAQEQARELYQFVADQPTATPRSLARAYQGLGRLESFSGDLPAALNLMLAASEQWPENGIIHFDLVRIYADMKNFESAWEEVSKAEDAGETIPAGFKRQLRVAQQRQ